MLKYWKRKALCGILAAALGLGALPLPAAAAESAEILPPEIVREADGQGGFTALAESVDNGIGSEGLVSRGTTFAAPANLIYDGGDMYSQLTTRQKACYDALEAATLNRVLASGTVQHDGRTFYRILADVSGISGLSIAGSFTGSTFVPNQAAKEIESGVYTDLMAAIVAMRYDRPDMMWLNYIRYGYGAEQSSQYATPRITSVMFDFYLEYGSQTRIMVESMTASARSIAAQAEQEKDTYSKVKKIYDTLAAMNTYGDPDDDRSHIPYAALISGDSIQPVCDGYAKAFKIVCDLVGIPCAMPSSATHMWNNVKMDDGDWYNVDLTWGDVDPENLSYAYFLVGSQAPVRNTTFAKETDHVEENPYEAYRLENPGVLKAVTLTFPAKNKNNYVYLGKDYDPLTFPDVKRSSWYYDPIESAAELKLFAGNEKGLFLPNDNITRAQFALVLANLMDADLEPYTGQAFSDVPTGKWYSKAVAWAKDKGYMSGDGALFRPLDNITRQEMCVVLAKAAPAAGAGDGSIFPDDAKISRWAREAVYACKTLGLVQGDNQGLFNPLGNTQRSAAAVVFTKLSALLEPEESEPEEDEEKPAEEENTESGEETESGTETEQEAESGSGTGTETETGAESETSQA